MGVSGAVSIGTWCDRVGRRMKDMSARVWAEGNGKGVAGVKMGQYPPRRLRNFEILSVLLLTLVGFLLPGPLSRASSVPCSRSPVKAGVITAVLSPAEVAWYEVQLSPTRPPTTQASAVECSVHFSDYGLPVSSGEEERGRVRSGVGRPYSRFRFPFAFRHRGLWSLSSLREGWVCHSGQGVGRSRTWKRLGEWWARRIVLRVTAPAVTATTAARLGAAKIGPISCPHGLVTAVRPSENVGRLVDVESPTSEVLDREPDDTPAVPSQEVLVVTNVLPAGISLPPKTQT
ncbi:hypothetical protein FIBSPDRAFT_884856 [Athelia psychrophila]|uniref:Uncharacterized protein n=1 Tax=Athelia psychrophila TaxID=1759441 RepID=A0A166SGF7_9AGAM|nr:hypothetical protein FIBSPDRAFT_884856 [Fibularhizoctonia sp. CBS 109695]